MKISGNKKDCKVDYIWCQLLGIHLSIINSIYNTPKAILIPQNTHIGTRGKNSI